MFLNQLISQERIERINKRHQSIIIEEADLARENWKKRTGRLVASAYIVLISQERIESIEDFLIDVMAASDWSRKRELKACCSVALSRRRRTFSWSRKRELKVFRITAVSVTRSPTPDLARENWKIGRGWGKCGTSGTDLARENWKEILRVIFVVPCEPLISQERIERLHHNTARVKLHKTPDLARENWKLSYCDFGFKFGYTSDLARENWKEKLIPNPRGKPLLISQERIESQGNSLAGLCRIWHSWSRKRELKDSLRWWARARQGTDLARENWKSPTPDRVFSATGSDLARENWK